MLNLNQLKKLYTNSPLWVKNIYASIPFDIRNGREYKKWREFLNSKIDIEEYELSKIQESVLYAYEHTKYYKKLFTELDIHPQDIKSKHDFQKIPFVDKDIIRENYSDFLVQDFPKKNILKVTTGGSSGSPMEYMQSKNVWSKELACYMNFFAKHKYSPLDIKASFRGGDFSNLKKGTYWFFNPANNEIFFSPTHLNTNTVKLYVEYLNSIKPRFLYGYPSSMLFLMHNMKANSFSLNFDIHAIFLISESFTEGDVAQISLFFNCSVASTYGHSERLVLAESIGENIKDYKVNRVYGYFELINEDSKNINVENIKGEIVGTGFDNYAMPLLRYKTGDFTSFKNFDKQIINLVDSPRKQLYIDDKNNNKISDHALLRQSEMLGFGIIKYQIVQTIPGKIKLFLLTEKTFTETKQKQLLISLNSRVDNELDIEIIVTDKLILTKRGKCIPFIKEY